MSTDTTPTVLLKAGREKPVMAGHPWIFSGAIARAEAPGRGETVDVRAADGTYLGRGYFNAASQISVRLWTRQEEPVDAAFIDRVLAAAVARRRRFGLTFGAEPGPLGANAFRLVNAEADGCPGLVVDAYAGALVVQVLTLGIECQREAIVASLCRQLEPRWVYERSDADVRDREGLEARAGALVGDPPAGCLEVAEHGLRLLVDVRTGHKTGLYLDQRENRQRVAEYLRLTAAAGDAAEAGAGDILNAFSYTGGFGLAACRARPAARVLNLDASAEVLDLARQNAELNGVADRTECLQGNAFQVLRKLRDQGRHFGAVILDPPKFAHTQGQVMDACRGYKDLNLLALKLLCPGGLLATFSCSGAVTVELFSRVLAEAAADSGRTVRQIARLHQSLDHPVDVAFPQGEYLKGLVLQVE